MYIIYNLSKTDLCRVIKGNKINNDIELESFTLHLYRFVN